MSFFAFRMGEELILNLENIPLNYSISIHKENEIKIRRCTLFFVPITFAVILVIGLIGNILVIIVVSVHLSLLLHHKVK